VNLGLATAKRQSGMAAIRGSLDKLVKEEEAP